MTWKNIIKNLRTSTIIKDFFTNTDTAMQETLLTVKNTVEENVLMVWFLLATFVWDQRNPLKALNGESPSKPWLSTLRRQSEQVAALAYQCDIPSSLDRLILGVQEHYKRFGGNCLIQKREVPNLLPISAIKGVISGNLLSFYLFMMSNIFCSDPV